MPLHARHLVAALVAHPGGQWKVLLCSQAKQLARGECSTAHSRSAECRANLPHAWAATFAALPAATPGTVAIAGRTVAIPGTNCYADERKQALRWRGLCVLRMQAPAAGRSVALPELCPHLQSTAAAQGPSNEHSLCTKRVRRSCLLNLRNLAFQFVSVTKLSSAARSTMNRVPSNVN
jgi:hypothetical protein